MTIDLESLRYLLWEIDNQVVTPGIGYREVITRTERVVSEVIAELTARRARDAEVEALVDKADTAATVLSNLIAARQVDSGYSVYVTDLTSALLPFTGDKT